MFTEPIGNNWKAVIWRPLALIAAICLVFFMFNPQIIADWRIYSFDDGTYSHAYLIPLICTYIAFRAARSNMLNVRWSWLFFLFAAAILVAYQWFDFAHQRFFARLLVPAALMLCILTVLQANRFTVAIAGFFWFVTPIWGPINEILQWSSVKGTGALMSLTGIPTFVHGNYVQIPAGTFEIADGCSGLRYVIAALALVAFYSVLFLKRWQSAAALTSFALLGAMLTNWLRIAALVVIGQVSNMQAHIINDHNMFGWFLFLPLMLMVFAFASRLEAGDEEAVVTQTQSGKQDAGIDVRMSRFALLALTLVLVSGVSLRVLNGVPLRSFAAELDVATAEPIALPVKPAPQVYALSKYDVIDHSDSSPRQVIYDIEFDGSIDANRVEFFLNNPVPNGWRVVEDVVVDNQRIIDVKRGAEEGVITVSYKIGGRATANRGELRGMRIKQAMTFNRRSALHWTFTFVDSR